MTNKEAIEKLAYIKTHDTDPEDYEVFELAIKAFEFIEENFPNTFIDYLNGVQI